ncbi:DUF943 family protein [Atlantibacter subterranea]|uniref:DUF943 family protein n=1 Tax=Atlantibacter subterraneus TaxID=255519 RepID=A0ABU4E7B6_9ENTR|nr:DUF943 family protein [Atlantibacter subterranea]MDV7024966.1 DUF943 family protein [Atlantibacter subterranea]MDZ5668147.1 DUF943 family protein [Atlantibacter hermannii]
MKNKTLKTAAFLFIASGLYNLWTLRPVDILYIYSDAGWSVDLVVDHMPWTDRDKIDWYLAHQKQIKNKYPLLDGEQHNYYIWDIGNGFTNYNNSPHEDLLCLPTIKNDNNCIVKYPLLIVDEYPYRNARFSVYPWENEYELTPENKLERIYHEYLPE